MVEKIDSEASDQLDVEQQTELMHQGDSIWTAVFKADKIAIEALISTDSDVIYKRGPVGECPIHMLFLYGSDAHLEIARELITRFPAIVTQTYNKTVSLHSSFSSLVHIHHLDLSWRKCSSYCYCQT
jgi:hypothetical protein